ncbi:hypothetical protein [Desulfopila sp. IMCC35006]|uniref:hypothetical protein n=1 Tax=Desulfopila sp. IMCC35006 TaxID=2569542 RepID=UPI00129487CC|nr:hypothetical protein [Desulfopila sp. IMCC35006]
MRNPTKKKDGYLFCRMFCRCWGDAIAMSKLLRRGLFFDLFAASVHPIELFGHKPDYTGRPKLTKKLRITAGKTFFAESNIVF